MKKLILLATLLATPSIAAAQEVTGASKAPEATQTAPTAQNAPGAPQWFLQVDQHDLDVIGAALGAVSGNLAVRYDLPAWLLHLYARALGADWFTPRYRCTSCSRHVHLVRSRPDRAGIFGPADGGGRCLSCSGRTRP